MTKDASAAYDSVTMHDLEAMAKYYEEWWGNPRDPRNPTFAKLNKLVADRAPDGHGKRALDLGSGGGSIMRILLEKGYDVTGVEIRQEAAEQLRAKFPSARIIKANLNEWQPDGSYDLVTMMQLTQNFTPVELLALLRKVRAITPRLIINANTANSLQGKWVTWRKFKAPFVHLYRVRDFEKILNEAGFTNITYCTGVGFLMPITLLNNFRVQLIPNPVVHAVNRIMDPRFPRACALYYVETA